MSRSRGTWRYLVLLHSMSITLLPYNIELRELKALNKDAIFINYSKL